MVIETTNKRAVKDNMSLRQQFNINVLSKITCHWDNNST